MSVQTVVEGVVQFEQVPRSLATGALRYDAKTLEPVQRATVEVVDAGSGSTVAFGTTTDAGRYRLVVVREAASLDTATRWRVRVRAESRSANHHYTVRDNTQGEAMYALDSAPFAAPTTSTPLVLNLQAVAGWTGTGYGGVRAAAPFAILSMLVKAQRQLDAAVPNLAMPPLKVLWSVNNRPVNGNATMGETGTSLFMFDSAQRPQIVLLGMADVDTDEYDPSVIAHEWGHFLQQVSSRNDSPGGPHSIDDKIDMRGAFSEGFGNAWSGFVNESPTYSDALGPQQASGFTFNMAIAPRPDVAGWFNEGTVHYLLWHVERDLGIAAMHNALVGMKSLTAFTSIFSFHAALSARYPDLVAPSIARANSVGVHGTDALGTGEFNDGGVAGAAPVYAWHNTPLGQPARYCLHTREGTINRLGNHGFVRFSTPSTAVRTVRATRVSASDESLVSIPLLAVMASDQRTAWSSWLAGSQTSVTMVLPAGGHVLMLTDQAMTMRDVSHCFDISIE